MTNLILCGGSGTRLWPISRTSFPKQFIKLFNNQSLFQLTCQRNNWFDNRLIISNTEHYFLALDQTDEINERAKYILEPIGRNTAPAIAIASFSVQPDEIIFVTPSDHLIKNSIEYRNAVNRGIELAREGWLVTFGISPKSPDTGFGYIESDGETVLAFHEKPNLITAEQYLNSGKHFWNSGMFIFKASVCLEELQKYSADIFEKSKIAFEKISGNRVPYHEMAEIPDNSIDYAVMEKSKKIKVVKMDIDWSDVGSFDSLSNEFKNDDKNNFLISNSKRETVLIDVENLIVVDTDDALLISKKGSSQKVKDEVAKLKKRGSKIADVHLETHRPWGTYAVLESERGYKIKKIVVKPNHRLSLQKHYHRNEHWIVVSGTANVTIEDKSYLVRPNESTYIKMGDVHRLENAGKIPLVLIEVQVGEYTEEDDIVRIKDDFHRESHK